MHMLIIITIVTLLVGLLMFGAFVWYRILKEINIDIGDFDLNVFDDFHEDIGRITSTHS